MSRPYDRDPILLARRAARQLRHRTRNPIPTPYTYNMAIEDNATADLLERLASIVQKNGSGGAP